MKSRRIDYVGSLIVLLLAGHAIGHTTERVSVSSGGEEGNSTSFLAAISAGGRYVTFLSEASNLVDGDTNGEQDIFRYDRQTGQTIRVNVSSLGEQANSYSSNPSISGDGRLIAYESAATNLVPGDTNGFLDVFVHDAETGQTIRVSVTSSGEEGDEDSTEPSISADGRYVAFTSAAENLHPSGQGGVFAHDLVTGETTKASLTNLGGHTFGSQPSISADGRFVAFASSADNIDFGDPQEDLDIYVRDRVEGVTIWASPGPVNVFDSDSERPSVSADGRFVAFVSSADNLIPNGTQTRDAYLFDIETGELTLVTMGPDGQPANDPTFSAAVSADGRCVAFASRADNLVPDDSGNDTDVFVHDRETGLTTRVNINASGQSGNDDSFDPAISADGRFIAFASFASNLVPDDGNNETDVFVRDRGPGVPADHGTLIGAEFFGNLLLTIDPFTGEPAPIGFRNGQIVGLAYDPVNDLLYGIHGVDDRIYIFDRQTAEATPVGAIGALGFSFQAGLAFDPIREILYANDVFEDVLYGVDTTTGVGTSLVTITGTSADSIQGMAFDPRSDTLFGLSTAVVKIDTETGSTTPIGSLPTGTGGVWEGLSFDTELNALFATRRGQTTDLFLIDPGTGEATLVGPTGGPGSGVVGLAFVPTAAPDLCPADVSGDGNVGVDDLLAVLAAWGSSPGGPPDLDGDGTVGVGDILVLLAGWGPCPVPNDVCRDSIDVTEGVFTFTTSGALTDGPDHPECDFFGLSQIDNDLWFCYTASATGWTTASVCGSEFNTKLAVYDGCGCPPPAPPLICNDDSCGSQSEVSFAVTAGETYLIRVGGFAGATGEGALTIDCQSFAVPNDVCTFATPIIVPFTVVGTTVGALSEAGVPGCGAPISGPSVWYSLMGTGNTIAATTCLAGADFDTVIKVYCGDCSDLICVVSNDDAACDPLQPGVQWCSEAGREYFIVVHGFAGASGDFSMLVIDGGTPCGDPLDCGPS